MVVGVRLAVLQQITEINTIIYYLLSLLKNAGFGPDASLLANVGNGAINVSFTIVSILLIDRLGRRPLQIIGLFGMTFGLLVAAFEFLGGSHLQGVGADVAIFALFFYTASFAIGLGPVF